MSAADRIPLVSGHRRRSAHHCERLVGRFEATIPLSKPLIVEYLSIMGLHILTVTGLPHAVRGAVIYVMVKPGVIVGVPHADIIDIRPLYPS